MLLEPMNPAGARPADCQIRRELADLAAGLDAHFVHAGTALASAVEMIERMLGGLDGVVAALDGRTAGAAVADLEAVARRLIALPDVRVERAGHMQRVAAITGTLRDEVMDIHKTLRVLGIYGMNIKIAASGDARFVQFVEGMNERLASGDRFLADVMGQLKKLATGLADVEQIDRLLAFECDRVLPDVPRRLTADAVELNAYLASVADLARRVAAIARNIQGKVAVLLSALQVGDSTRQRLEHVIAMLQMLEGIEGRPAVAGHIGRLAAAQLDGAAGDFLRETKALIGSLDALVPDVGDLGMLIAEQGDGGGRGVLSRLDASVSGMDRMILQLQRAEGEADAMKALITDSVAGLKRRIGSLGRVQLDVQDIATNTRLLCRRHGETGKAVAVIATEIDALTHQLGHTTRNVWDMVAALGDAETLSSGTVTSERGVDETLRDALAIIRRACQQTDQVAMTGGDDARQLLALVETTAAELTHKLHATAAIEVAAVTLRHHCDDIILHEPDDEAILRDLLSTISRQYSMASERTIHADFLLPGMDDCAAADPCPEEEDDDGLF